MFQDLVASDLYLGSEPDEVRHESHQIESFVRIRERLAGREVWILQALKTQRAHREPRWCIQRGNFRG